MNAADAKEYLLGYQTGIANASKDKVATVGLEVAMSSVWGAHDWKIKRALVSASMVANQAYIVFPADFEAVLSFRIIHSSRPIYVDIKDENAFDYDYPNPAADLGDMPSALKVVVHSDKRYRAYFYRIPDAAYTYEVAYNKKSDLASLPDLPSYMLSAVLEKGKALMQGSPEKTFTQTQVATAELNQAIMADGVAKGYAPMVGTDPGFDDWFGGQGGGSVWYPR